MQIAGGNGAFPENATTGNGVAIHDGVLQGLDSPVKLAS